MLERLGRVGVLGLMLADPPGLFARLYGLDWYGGLLRHWADGLGLIPGQDVLELGCGPGLLCRHLAGQGMRVTGMDRSSRMIRRACAQQVEGLRFQVAALPCLPLPDASQDVVLAASLLNVVGDKAAALAEMVRVTRPGGLVSVLFPLPGLASVADGLAMELRGFSRAALRQWGRSGRPLATDVAVELFERAGLAHIRLDTALGGGIAMLRGRRIRPAA